jgi:hypothetical protein
MPTLETHYIGTDLNETITVKDSAGALIPDAQLSKVEAVVFLNNVMVEKFQWKTGGGSPDSGFTALINESAEGTFSLKIEGADQANWNQGMIEVAVRRVVTSGTTEQTQRFQVKMAKTAGGTNFSS